MKQQIWHGTEPEAPSYDPAWLQAQCHETINQIAQHRYGVKLLAIALESLQSTADYKQGRTYRNPHKAEV